MCSPDASTMRRFRYVSARRPGVSGVSGLIGAIHRDCRAGSFWLRGEPAGAGWPLSGQPVDREDHEGYQGADREAGAEVRQGVAPELVFAFVVAPDSCLLLAGGHGGWSWAVQAPLAWGWLAGRWPGPRRRASSASIGVKAGQPIWSSRPRIRLDTTVASQPGWPHQAATSSVIP